MGLFAALSAAPDGLTPGMVTIKQVDSNVAARSWLAMVHRAFLAASGTIAVQSGLDPLMISASLTKAVETFTRARGPRDRIGARIVVDTTVYYAMKILNEVQPSQKPN